MKRIFCVEDDLNIRELIEYTLKQTGFEVSGFECAADFFKALSDTLPELVLLDIMLPDKDGLEILKDLFGYVCTFEKRRPIFHKL